MSGDGTAPGGSRPQVRLTERDEAGTAWPVLVWAAGPGWRMISSGVVGGGIGQRSWWLNAGVPRSYARTDPDRHVVEIASAVGLQAGSPGVGMLTAVDVRTRTQAHDGGVHVVATVGLGVPVLAAAGPQQIAGDSPPLAGTINVLVVLPASLTDAALVNAVLSATEAKTQALVEYGVPGTGTSSDSVCIACPVPQSRSDPVEPFGGPRSRWGWRLARAVHRAVGDGTAGWLARHR